MEKGRSSSEWGNGEEGGKGKRLSNSRRGKMAQKKSEYKPEIGSPPE